MTWYRYVVSLLTCSFLFGCASMTPIQPSTVPGGPVYGTLKPGDTIVVYTSDGGQRRVVVDRTEGDAIVARGGDRFTHQSIVRVERRNVSGARTAMLIGGIAAGVVMLSVGAWIAQNSR